MVYNEITKNVLSSVVEDATTAGTTSVISDIVDMGNPGAEGVVFMVAIDVSDPTNQIYLQQGAASDMSDAADLEGTAFAATEDGGLAMSDLQNPEKRYVRAVVERPVSTAISPIIAIKYNLRLVAVDNPAVSNNRPDEGTP